MTLRLGLPSKGRLMEDALAWLKARGVAVERAGGSRAYAARSDFPGLEPVLLAKIKRARELLHQEFVTDEDIFRLEREGRFQDLKVEPAPPAPTGAPPRNPAR